MDVRTDTKCFRKGRQRSLFLLDQDAEEGDEQDDQQDEDEQGAQDPDAGEDETWESYAFDQRKSFSPCTTAYCKEKNIAHTHFNGQVLQVASAEWKGRKRHQGK